MAYVQIDLDDYVSDIEDDVIRDEFERRKLSLPVNNRDLEEVIRDAYEELLRGRPTEARAILERILYPKWNSREQCKSELASLTALQSDAVRAIEELDCLYINGERHPFGGIPADGWSSARRAALQEAIDAIIADQRGDAESQSALRAETSPGRKPGVASGPLPSQQHEKGSD